MFRTIEKLNDEVKVSRAEMMGIYLSFALLWLDKAIF